MNGTVSKTFKHGPVWASVIEFEGELPLGFAMWRWMPRGAGHNPRTQTFRASHLHNIAALLEQMPEEMSALQRGSCPKTPVPYELRPAGEEHPLFSVTIEDVLMTIHESKKGPWFMIRRIAAVDPLHTANWFFAAHLEAVEAARAAAEEWFAINAST